jgi:hypothetical protein
MSMLYNKHCNAFQASKVGSDNMTNDLHKFTADHGLGLEGAAGARQGCLTDLFSRWDSPRDRNRLPGILVAKQPWAAA